MDSFSGECWLLALESSTDRGGGALLRGGEVVDSVDIGEGLRHGRDLMPAASRLLGRNGVDPARIGAVAISAGPGSYTGMRVGVMSAKAFAYASGCALAAVSSLAALAETLAMARRPAAGTRVMTAQNARRDEVYAGLYEIGGDGLAAPLRPDAAVTPEEAAALFAEYRGGDGCLAAGSAFVDYAGLFGPLPDAPLVHPRAEATGRLAWGRLLRGESDDPLALQPVYLRRDPDTDWSRDELIGHS